MPVVKLIKVMVIDGRMIGKKNVTEKYVRIL